MRHRPLLLSLMALGTLLLVACSTTTLSGSWKNTEYQGRVRTPYIIGVATDETARRMFEDGLVEALQPYGVVALPSYRDLPDAQNTDKEVIAEQLRKGGADSVLMMRVTASRTEQIRGPARISGYETGPYYSPTQVDLPQYYYRNWSSYYERRFEALYEPSSMTAFEVATIEANLYDGNSGNLIWSAQLETVIDDNLQQLVSDFARTVTRDLHAEGML